MFLLYIRHVPSSDFDLFITSLLRLCFSFAALLRVRHRAAIVLRDSESELVFKTILYSGGLYDCGKFGQDGSIQFSGKPQNSLLHPPCSNILLHGILGRDMLRRDTSRMVGQHQRSPSAGRSDSSFAVRCISMLTIPPVIAVLFTFAVAIYTVVQHHRGSNPFTAHGTLYTIVRLVIEVIAFFLWIGSAALALRPHGGCDPKHRIPSSTGEDRCWRNPDVKDGPSWKYTNQPLITWDLAIAFSFVEM